LKIGRNCMLNLSFLKKIDAYLSICNPRNATIQQEAFKQIENNSVFIDYESLGNNIEEREEKAYLEIIKVSDVKSIYLSKELNDGKYSY